jgi:hypothetical protein
LYSISLNNTKNLEYCPVNPGRKPDEIKLDIDQITDNSFLNSTSWPLLQLMTKDIYRPPRMGVVFSHLYPKEFFDPFTSTQRVRNSILRFNAWANGRDLDFRIKIQSGDFQLVCSENAGIKIQQRRRTLESWQAKLKVFKDQNESRSFTSGDVGRVLGISARSSLTIIQKALSSKKIEKIGHGKNVRYIFFSGRRAA